MRFELHAVEGFIKYMTGDGGVLAFTVASIAVMATKINERRQNR